MRDFEKRFDKESKKFDKEFNKGVFMVIGYGVFISTLIAIVIFSAVQILSKEIKTIDNNGGLKSVIERVWEGKENGTN